jgi:hypothetical protein
MSTVQLIIVGAVVVFGALYWMRRSASAKARQRNR